MFLYCLSIFIFCLCVLFVCLCVLFVCLCPNVMNLSVFLGVCQSSYLYIICPLFRKSVSFRSQQRIHITQNGILRFKSWRNVILENMSALAGPDPPRLAGRTGLEEFGPGWLGMAGQARKSWPGPAAEFNTPQIYCCLLFLERSGSDISVLSVMYNLWKPAILSVVSSSY